MAGNPASDSAGRGEGVAGFALVAVLLFLLIVSAVITPFVLAARTDFLLSSRQYLIVRQQMLARGVAQAIARQIAGRDTVAIAELKLDSEPMRVRCGPHDLTIVAQDQAGLADLNTSPRGLLEAGFLALGFSAGDAANLADAAVAYRSPQGGGGGGANRLVPAGLKHFPFDAIEELYEFEGMAGMAPGTLRRVMTVYNRSAVIDPDAYSPALRRVLPDNPTSRHPYVSAAPLPLVYAMVSVEVVDPDLGVRGYWGGYFEFPEAEAGFKLMEPASDSVLLVNAPRALSEPFVATDECAAIVGPGVANWLANR
ncbi:MAG: hypothetical protein KDJ80_06915 [Nitratireductor sp.]|nr:hypothetical protein [Nitratireductor sp.]